MSSRRLQYVSIGTRSDHSRTCKDTNQIKVTFTKVSFDLEFLRRAALTRVARARARGDQLAATRGPDGCTPPTAVDAPPLRVSTE